MNAMMQLRKLWLVSPPLKLIAYYWSEIVLLNSLGPAEIGPAACRYRSKDLYGMDLTTSFSCVHVAVDRTSYINE